MNATLRNALALSAAVLAAGSAFADGDTYPYPQAFTSTTTRAAVKADVLRARADGTLVATESDLQKDAPFASRRSRAEVRAEAISQQTISDELAAEPHGFTVEPAGAPMRTASR